MAAAYAVGGVALGIASLLIDAAVGVPGWLQVGAATARSLTTGFAASFLFVVSIVFWVRLYAVQVAAEPFSARVRRLFLTDRVHRNAMGFILGALTCTVIVATEVPDGEGVSGVPHLSVALVGVLAVLVGLTIVYVVHNAAWWGEIGRLTRWIAEECIDVTRRGHPPHDPARRADAATAHQVPAAPPATEVLAERSGWVQRVDVEALARALPAGTTVALQLRVGWFVIEGTPIAAAWTDGARATSGAVRPGGGVGEVHAAIESAVAAAVTVGPEATAEQDASFGIGQLVDIAERSLAPTLSDSTTACEVALYVGVVLRELLLRDLPPAWHVDGDRRVLRPHERDLEDHLDLAFDRIRRAGGGSPEVLVALLGTIDMLLGSVHRAGLHDRAGLLEDHAARIAGTAEERLAGTDLERVRRKADAVMSSTLASTERSA